MNLWSLASHVLMDFVEKKIGNQHWKERTREIHRIFLSFSEIILEKRVARVHKLHQATQYTRRGIN